MATTSDTQTFARALYETVLGTSLDQLQLAVSKLSGVSESDPNVQQRLEAALPATAQPEVRNFLMVLAREGVLDQLPEIAQAFEAYIQRGPQLVNAEVTSAVALDEAQRERIVRELRQQYPVDLDVHFRIDPSLIGGLIIRVGDRVLDNSLRTRLGMLQRNMLTS